MCSRCYNADWSWCACGWPPLPWRCPRCDLEPKKQEQMSEEDKGGAVVKSEKVGDASCRIDIWKMPKDLDDEPTLLETIILECDDAQYGDNGEALYLTGEDARGRFIEVVVAVPERVARLKG